MSRYDILFHIHMQSHAQMLMSCLRNHSDAVLSVVYVAIFRTLYCRLRVKYTIVCRLYTVMTVVLCVAIHQCVCIY